MMKKILARRRWHVLLGGVVLGALVLTGVFAVRARHALSDLKSPADEPIRAWMNVPYIAHAYQVPPDALLRALQLDPSTRDPRPLSAIARTQNRPVALLIADVEQAIIALRAPPAPPRPPSPPVPAAPSPPRAGAP
jgi:hypothetical protein